MYFQSRRILHQPFFPLFSSPPPTHPPSPSPSSSFPKYPSSTIINSRPFFPTYPSPPPPPPSSSSSSLPTFPANISTLISPSRHSSSSSSKLVLTIAFPLLSLALLALTLAFFFLRRGRRSSSEKLPASDSHSLFPPNSTASDGRKLSPTSVPTSSDFLYLGTLVNSRGHTDEGSAAAPATASSPYQKLDSPELRPLPPLARQARRSRGKGEDGWSSEEEFYSPSASPGEKDSSPREPASSSQRTFQAAEIGKCGVLPVSTLSTLRQPGKDHPTYLKIAVVGWCGGGRGRTGGT